MINLPWQKFIVVEEQIGIEHLSVVRRSRGVLVAEIGTKQKYPAVCSWSGTEVLIGASPGTPRDKYDPEALPTAVVFPRRQRGRLCVVHTGRYTVYLALYKPWKRVRHHDAFVRRDRQWRTRLLARGCNKA